jgi:ribosomal protein L37AE/L43A
MIWTTLSILLFFLLCGGALFLLFLIFRDTKRKQGNWGIPFKRATCPQCEMKSPFSRIPTSFRQAMWGGWSCSICGCEMDKWGKEIPTENQTQNSQRQIKQVKEDFIKPFDEKGKTPVEKIFQEKE